MKKLLQITLAVLSISLSLSLCTPLSAQSNYRDGYIITLAKDTIKGHIDLRTDRSNSKICRFKYDLDSEEQVYRPGEIEGYRFISDGKFYVSKNMTIDGVTEILFVEYLVQGTMSLYYLSNSNFYHFLLTNAAGEERLVSINRTQKNETYLKDIRLVRGKLNDFLGNRPELKKLILNISDSNSKNNMTELLKAYNDLVCPPGKTSCIIFEYDRNQHFFATEFSILAGAYNDRPNMSDYFYPGVILEATFPYLGIRFSVKSPRLSNRFFVDLCLGYSYFKYDQIIPCSYSVYDYMIDVSRHMLHFNGNLRYLFLKNRLSPYLEGGFSYKYVLTGSVYDGFFSATENKFIYQNRFTKGFLGYNAGIGLNFKTIKDQSIFTSITFDHVFGNYETLKGFKFSLGYTF